MLNRTCGLLALLLIAMPCRAGWISEIDPGPRTVLDRFGQAQVLPRLVELSGLANLGAAQLLVVDATPGTRCGRLLQIIDVPAGAPVRLLIDSPWPLDAPVWDPANPTVVQPPVTLPGGQSFDFTGPRGLCLFDGPTGLQLQSGKIQDLLPTLPVHLLDAVAFGPAGQTSAPLGAPGAGAVVAVAAGDAIARPNQSEAGPWDNLYLVGAPDTSGVLAGTTPAYRLNPGQINPVWAPDPAPEPGTAALLALPGAALLARRRRAG